jgi:hypothetical protein
MLNSASLVFPFHEDYENSCLKRATTIESTILSAVRLFLITRKGSRLGNSIGSILPELLFNLISFQRLGTIGNQIKAELTQQFPGINFIDVSLSLQRNETVDVIVKIKLTIPTQDNIIELTEVLPTIFSEANLATINVTDL